MRPAFILTACSALLGGAACSSAPQSSDAPSVRTTTAATSTGLGNTTTTAGLGQGGSGALPGTSGLGIGGFDPGTAGSGVLETCATETSTANLEPVYLAFGFDRSGSMGKGDKDWHDQSLKWDPVATATSAFFADPASTGLSAALKFFPDSDEEDERCDPDRYASPEIPMTPLPSDDFEPALNAIPEEDWIGGTPTLAVLSGLITYVETERALRPGRYAIVLVTDGYPQDCDDSSIESVAELAASVADTIPTYVIGVANPPFDDAPDTVTNLAAVAEAGATGQAFLIDTGDPTQTSEDFRAAIDEIRGAAISCDVAIPEPPADRVFDERAVEVTYTTGSGSLTSLRYDPACDGLAWHYDDPETPSRIVLCPDACQAVQAEAAATLAVNFACEPLFEIPK